MTTSSSTLSPPESPPPLASSVLPQEERPDEEDPHEHSPPPHPPSAKALGKRRAQETEIIADHQPPNGVVLKPIKSKGTKNTSKKGKKGVHAKEEEKEATTTQRRVQPARSRRGGPGIGSSAVDVMILESHQRAAENRCTINPDALFLITTDSREVPSGSTDGDNHQYESYFDRAEVMAEYKKQEVIETPEYTILDEHSAVGSRLRARAVLEDAIDTSDAVYERRHRKYETFEKRQRFREKETLQYEHFKLRERMEELKVMDVQSFDRVGTGSVAAMDGLAAEERKRVMMKEAEELDRRYAILLHDKKGAGLALKDRKKGGKGWDDETGSERVSDSGVSKLRLRLKRSKAAVEREEATPEAGRGETDDERETDEVERTVGVDEDGEVVSAGEEDDMEEGEQEEDEAGDDYPSHLSVDEDGLAIEEAPSPKRKRRRISASTRKSNRSVYNGTTSSPLPSHPKLPSHSRPFPRAQATTNSVPILLQAALRSKQVAQPNAKRQQAPRHMLPFGAHFPAILEKEIDFELPPWVVGEVEDLAGLPGEPDGDDDED